MKTLSIEPLGAVESVNSLVLFGGRFNGDVLLWYCLDAGIPIYYPGNYEDVFLYFTSEIWRIQDSITGEYWQHLTSNDPKKPAVSGWEVGSLGNPAPTVGYKGVERGDSNTTIDIHLDAAGNLAIATDAEGLRQKLQTRLKLYQGEWFLNSGAGVPYLQRILGRAQSPGNLVGSVAQIFDVEILKEPEVLSIVNSRAEFDADQRRYVYTAELETVHGPMNIEEIGNG